MKNIIIVGGGTSGYSAALILKTRFPLINITVIKSDKIGIIGVGESTHHFGEFTDFVGLNRLDYFKECDATVKYGVFFKDWDSVDFLHSTNMNSEIRRGQFRGFYAHCMLQNINSRDMVDEFKRNNLICQKEYNDEFHFNTFKLNIFLEKKCLEKGIKIITDEITKVNIKNNNIKNLNNKYTADFYLDCSGFKKILMSKLGAKWISYQDYLPCNEAIAFQTPDTNEYNSYTLSQAMKYGWMWRIPVWGRWGNGYVFDNTLINADQAKQEVETFLGHKIEIVKNIKFEAGALDKFWIGNCCAIGLSSSFVEPLESSAIAATHMQVFLLLNYLINYNEENRIAYNEKTKAMMENVRDFIIMHYITDKKGVFWKKAKNLPKPSSLQFNLNMWKNRLPIRSDFGDYKVYFEINWTPLLMAKGLINKNKVLKEYQLMGKEMIKSIQNEINLNNPYMPIKHKEYLKTIRNK
jgi:tryptophan halogenase